MIKKNSPKFSKRLVFLCSLLAAVLLATVCVSYNVTKTNPVIDKIIRYVDVHDAPEGVVITLTDFTHFDWDKALVHIYPTSKQQIFDALGVEYKKSLDLTTGIIFVKDNKIVHDIIFKDSYYFDTPPLFSMYPHSDIGQTPYFNIFTRDEAVFICIKNKYVSQQKNYSYYVLLPTH